MKFDLLLEVFLIILLMVAITVVIAIFVLPSPQQGGNIVSDLINGVIGIFA